MGTIDARSFSSLDQEDLRYQAVKAVMAGKTQVEVANMMGVTRQAVGKWVKTFRTGGGNALAAKRKGRPEGAGLLSGQEAKIVKTIVDQGPEELRLPFHLWNREAIAQLIAHMFDTELSPWTVRRYLARWEFKPRHSVRWGDDPGIREQAREEKAQILRVDEKILRSQQLSVAGLLS